MKSSARFPWGPLLRETKGTLLPALLGVGLFLTLSGSSRGDEQGEKPKAGDPELCGEWHRGGGESSPLDLAAVKRAYGALRDRVAKSLDRSKEEAAGNLERAFDAGLPACRGESTRVESLPQAKALGLRGRVFYFVSVSDPARVALPPEVADEPLAQVLVLRARALKDLPELSRTLGRPVSLAGADLARALGVRCANTWLRVSEKGEAVELYESR